MLTKQFDDVLAAFGYTRENREAAMPKLANPMADNWLARHRDQLRRGLSEFLGRILDRLAFVDRLDLTEPRPLGATTRVALQSAPDPA